MASSGVDRNMPPACNQCRARKVRCRREQPVCSNCAKSGLPCDFTNKSKRINHTKLLAEDFSRLSGRLERIEYALARINHHFDTGGFPVATTSQVTRQSLPLVSGSRWEDQSCAVQDIAPTWQHGAGLPHVLCGSVSGGRTFHGPTSTVALLRSTRSIVDALFHIHTPSQLHTTSRQSSITSPISSDTSDPNAAPSTASLTQDATEAVSNTPSSPSVFDLIDRHMKVVDCCDQTAIKTDGRPVSTPPQAFVRTAVKHFLVETNRLLPIFDAQRLVKVVEEHYHNPPSDISGAWNLCLNNIVVLSMRSRLQGSNRRADEDDEVRMDHDLFGRFLTNSCRAFTELDNYNEARLINVQALMTLALIAIEHFSDMHADQLIRRACLLGKEIGLQYEDDSHAHQDANEARMVFWALYILDKKRAFTSGTSCDIYLFDCDVPLVTLRADTSETAYYIAKIHVLSLWEEIWTALYCARAKQCSSSERCSRITRLDLRLEDWAGQYYTTAIPDPLGIDRLDLATSARLELLLSYHVGKLYLHRCRQDPMSLQICRKNARTMLQLFLTAATVRDHPLKLGLVLRMYRLNVMIGFVELHQSLLSCWDTNAAQDLELLFHVYKAVKTLNEDTNTSAVCLRIPLDSMNWCLRINQLVNSLLNRPFNRTIGHGLPNLPHDVWKALCQQVSHLPQDVKRPHHGPVGEAIVNDELDASSIMAQEQGVQYMPMSDAYDGMFIGDLAQDNTLTEVPAAFGSFVTAGSNEFDIMPALDRQIYNSMDYSYVNQSIMQPFHGASMVHMSSNANVFVDSQLHGADNAIIEQNVTDESEEHGMGNEAAIEHRDRQGF